MMQRYAALVIPVVLGCAANSTDYLPLKMAEPLACAVIVWVVYLLDRPRQRDLFALLAAFAFSALGDYFLSNKRGSESYFVIGIGCYFFAHLGYLSLALWNGRISWKALCRIVGQLSALLRDDAVSGD